MRTVKKLLALMLVLAFALSFTACGKPDSENIVGVWEFEQTFESATYDITSAYTCRYTFTETGDFSFMVDEDSWTALREDVATQYRPLLEAEIEANMETIAQSSGLTVEEALSILGASTAVEAWCNVLGTTMDALVWEYVETILVPASFSGTYQVPEDGHLELDAGETGTGSYGITFADNNTLEWYTYTDVENRVREEAPLITLTRGE